MSFFRLIRLPNLLIVALTQYLLYYQVITPALKNSSVSSALTFEHFSLLIFITVLITAGGYIINDIVDLRIDLINKPDRVIIGRYIAHQTAYWLYFCINISGFVLSMYLAFVADRIALLFLFPVAVSGLLIYSVFLKKRPLSGNLLVSLYCAGVAAIVWVAEAPALARLSPSEAAKIVRLLVFYAVFAFISTLFREIVKDLEDAYGDARGKARTAPVVWGENIARWLAATTGMALLLSLGYAAFALRQYLNKWGLPFVGFVIVLTVAALYLLLKANKKQEYHNLSQFAKIIILCGVLLLLFFE